MADTVRASFNRASATGPKDMYVLTIQGEEFVAQWMETRRKTKPGDSTPFDREMRVPVDKVDYRIEKGSLLRSASVVFRDGRAGRDDRPGEDASFEARFSHADKDRLGDFLETLEDAATDAIFDRLPPMGASNAAKSDGQKSDGGEADGEKAEADRTEAARPAPGASTAAAPPSDLAARLRELAALRDEGVLTEEEFTAAKAKILG